MFKEQQCMLNDIAFIAPVWYFWKNVFFWWLRAGFFDMFLILWQTSGVNNDILGGCSVIYHDAFCDVDGKLR